MLRRTVPLVAAALAAAMPLLPNQYPQMAAWEDEIIKARVAIPDDPASNTTYNRAKMADAISRKRAPGAEIVGYCAPAVSLHRAPGVSLTALSPAQIP